MQICQLLAELYHCSPAVRDEAKLTGAAEAAARRVGATIVGRYSLAYKPHGLMVAVFLAESHIILTTWPEHDLLLVDCLLCNPTMSYDDVLDEIRTRLCPDGEVVSRGVERQIASEPPSTAGRRDGAPG